MATRLSYIPPLGPVGASSTTQAAQLVLAGRSKSANAPTVRTRRAPRRRPAPARRAPTRGRKLGSSKKRSPKMVKGSAAAKRHMARLRKMRRK